MTVAFSGVISFPAAHGRSKIEIRRIIDLRIESGFKMLTGTAEISFPRNMRNIDQQKVNELFKKGDPVSISLGYGGDEWEEFTGYVLQVSTGFPVVIKCEDEMYNLKRRTVSVSKKTTTLKDLLTQIAPGYTILCDDANIGSVRYSSVLVSEVLDDLKQKLGFYAYFRGKTLVCGRTSIDGGEHVKIIVEKQASDSLKEKSIEKVYVRVESLQKNGKMLKADKGEKNSNNIIIKQPNLTEVEIKKIVNATYEKALAPGLDGELTVFGVPRLMHGMIADVESTIYPAKNGSYYIDSVTKTVSVLGGYRQIAKLGDKTT
ncbi:MAG: hypothetical protein VB066_01755 [Paludibacter sp.]|nr:hypothetical protein [Paludibacter sp.]